MKPPIVYFFIPDHIAYYDDAIIYLAEGLKELKVPFYSNKNFWIEEAGTDTFLFNYDQTISFKDCDIIIFSSAWFEYIDYFTHKPLRQEIPEGLFDKGRKYQTVYIDTADGYKTVSWEDSFRQFDLILRAKYNKRTFNPPNVKPWVHGFYKRIIKATAHRLPAEQRRKVILQNFNHTHGFEHYCRRIGKEKILPLLGKYIPIDTTKTSKDYYPDLPYDQIMWNQTSGRHNPDYYKRLCTSFANACFCGEVIPGLPADPGIYLVGGNRAKIKRKIWQVVSLLTGSEKRIIQWDSWRFWETLAAGCLAIHIDLNKYGVDLPVMPQNWEHYVGFDLNNIERDVQRFVEDYPGMQKIAENGHKWVFEYYSPEISARRFLKELEWLSPENEINQAKQEWN